MEIWLQTATPKEEPKKKKKKKKKKRDGLDERHNGKQ